jgi:hypothetical protein
MASVLASESMEGFLEIGKSRREYARKETAAADRPGFYICIGDDFSVEKVPPVTHEALLPP